MSDNGTGSDPGLAQTMGDAELAMSEFGVVTEARTLRIRRVLPGPIERVWAYLTELEKRGRWLAAGPMELRVGGRVELTFRNSELSGARRAASGQVQGARRRWHPGPRDPVRSAARAELHLGPALGGHVRAEPKGR